MNNNPLDKAEEAFDKKALTVIPNAYQSFPYRKNSRSPDDKGKLWSFSSGISQLTNRRQIEDLNIIQTMSDKDYAPLSSHCVRALCDKMYDKRKAAALEIEKMTKECVQINNSTQIYKLLRVLGTDFCCSQNPNMRKGGLIGLAAMAIGLSKDSGDYVSELVNPVLSCMDDSDSRVRFYACESLYNVTKVTRDHILPLFNDIFVSMAKVVTDLDLSVRNAAELLDRLLKDIITEHKDFKTENFIPTLKECMYTDDQFGRSFCIGWVQAMHKVPSPTITKHLPEIIDPLFTFLTDSRSEIYVRCQTELEKFLGFIKNDPPSHEAFTLMVNNLVVHVQSDHIRPQTMSVHWIRAFAEISGQSLFPYISGILAAILPNLSYEEEKRRSVSEHEYKRIRVMSKKLYRDLQIILEKKSKELQDTNDKEDFKQLESILDVATQQLQSGQTESKIGALNWISLLFTLVMPFHIDNIFPTLLKTLSDSNDEVVILDLRVLALICKPSGNHHFKPFMNSLYRLFSADRSLLQTKGAYIIRQLSVYLSPVDIYRSMAELIQNEEDLKFARLYVEYLNTIMFTAKELQSLRESIKMLETPESKELFICLYKTWSHSQAPTIALVFLAGCYNHALDLVRLISEQEITLDFLLELDRLVQILESGIFSFLRYELLDPENNGDLVKAIYGLLNLMPQSTAFKLLNDRLKNLPPKALHKDSPPKKLKKIGVGNKCPKEIDFNELLNHFSVIQDKHEKIRLKEVSGDIMTEDQTDQHFQKKLNLSETEDYSIVDEEL